MTAVRVAPGLPVGVGFTLSWNSLDEGAQMLWVDEPLVE